MMKITLMIATPHASSPHERVVAAIEALQKVVRDSTPDQPALGGALYDGDRNVGCYLVEFGGRYVEW